MNSFCHKIARNENALIAYYHEIRKLFMFKLPMIAVYMIISLNITAFALVIQFDWLIFHAVIVNSAAVRIVLWMLAIASWYLAYIKRDKFVTLF